MVNVTPFPTQDKAPGGAVSSPSPMCDHTNTEYIRCKEVWEQVYTCVEGGLCGLKLTPE